MLVMEVPESLADALSKIASNQLTKDAVKEILLHEETSHHLWGQLGRKDSWVAALKRLKDEGRTEEEIASALETLSRAVHDAIEERGVVTESNPNIMYASAALKRAWDEVFGSEELGAAGELEGAATALRKILLKRNLKWELRKIRKGLA